MHLKRNVNIKWIHKSVDSRNTLPILTSASRGSSDKLERAVDKTSFATESSAASIFVRRSSMTLVTLTSSPSWRERQQRGPLHHQHLEAKMVKLYTETQCEYLALVSTHVPGLHGLRGRTATPIFGFRPRYPWVLRGSTARPPARASCRKPQQGVKLTKARERRLVTNPQGNLMQSSMALMSAWEIYNKVLKWLSTYLNLVD